MFPEARLEPPAEAAYQLTVPAEGIAVKVTGPLLHLLLFVTEVIVGRAFTVATTAVLVSVVQPADVAST